MLFKMATLEAIAAGKVTLAFRRWKRPTVAAGRQLRTAIGVLDILTVEPISTITDADARKAGYANAAAASADLRTEGALYRISFRPAGADPRIALRSDARLSAADRADIEAQLAKLDRRSAWTGEALDAIARHPGRRAPELAAALGRETLPFKRDVRKLKELGLTESLEVGYRLSPRGRAFLKRR